MRRTGCVTVALGVESVNPRTLVDYNKHQSVPDIVNCIMKLKAHDIRALCMFVLGGDSDSPLSIRETTRFLKRWKPRYAQFSILCPFPGTRYYDEMNKVFRGRFGDEPPVRTTIAAVAGVPGNSLVEIDVIACI